MRTAIFIADYPYERQNEGELSFEAGDKIRVVNSDGDWWYGELMTTKEEGWLSPLYGHVEEDVSPYIGPSSTDQENLNKRTALFMEIIKVETAFCQKLDAFNKAILTPLFARDTSFKRNFLNDSSIAVSLTLMRDIFVSSSTFLQGIQQASSAEAMAASYLNLVPTLKLYAQYASENASCLNAVKGFGRQLKDFAAENPLPQKLTLEACLVLPLEHYSKYATNLQEFVWLTPQTKPEYKVLQEALAAISAQTEKVDDVLNELAASVKLLTLQSKCK
jgi:hypothetical protein